MPTCHRCLLVPMRDGVQLAIDLVRPDGDGPWPGLVFRTPYGRGVDGLKPYAERGYLCLMADARGTGASEGDYDYYNMDAGRFDGYDLIEWLAAHDDCNGAVAAVGGSAMGIYAICAAAERPPSLRTMVLDVVPADFYEHQWYPGGVLRTENRHGWSIGTGNRIGPDAVWDCDEEEANRPHKAALQAKRHRRFCFDPLGWAEPYFSHRERNPLWDAIDLRPRLERIEVPVLFGGVLYDHFGKGTLAALDHHPGPHRLSMQGGQASRPLEAGGWDLPWDLRMTWLDHHLKGEGPAPEPGQTWHITGIEQRRDFPGPPPVTTRVLHLGNVGFADQPGSGDLAVRHDPDRPLLSNLAAIGTVWDPVLAHPDAVVIDADPVTEATVVIGHPTLRLRLRADHRAAQLVARICVLQTDGSTRMLNFGARRIFLSADRRQVLPCSDEPQEVELEFWTVAHAFQPGERLRIVLSGSEAPFFELPEHAFTITIDRAASTLELPVLTELAG